MFQFFSSIEEVWTRPDFWEAMSHFWDFFEGHFLGSFFRVIFGGHFLEVIFWRSFFKGWLFNISNPLNRQPLKHQNIKKKILLINSWKLISWAWRIWAYFIGNKPLVTTRQICLYRAWFRVIVVYFIRGVWQSRLIYSCFNYII
jgi:hypothetical protein